MDEDILLEEGIQEIKEIPSKDKVSSENKEKDKKDAKKQSSRHKYSKSKSIERKKSKKSKKSSLSRRDRTKDRSSSRRRLRRHSRSRSRSYSRSSSRGRRHSRHKRNIRSKSRSPIKSSKKENVEEKRRSTSAERLQKRIEREKQRELMELTRDHRTVFVGQLQRKVRDRDLEKFFKQIGPIENVLLIKDKFTGRSKGFAYVEMSSLDDVPKVLMMNGQIPPFQVFPILVKASEAEKNFTAKKEAAATAAYMQYLNGGTISSTGGSGSSGTVPGMANGGYSSTSAASRIYCGNLHTNVVEEDLKMIFMTFGEVLNVNINRDEMGRSKGYGFIQFQTPEQANLALQKGNGIELAGNYLKLGCVNENAMMVHGAGVGGTANANNWKLDDDDEGAGMAMNAHSRTALMAKLAGGTGAEFMQQQENKRANLASASAAKAASVVPPNSSTVAPVIVTENVEGTESFCVVVKNMYDPFTETGEEWHLEIKQELEEECGKYGKVLHSFVAKEKPGGLVYVLFEKMSVAIQVAKIFHGRWFNRRQLTVRYLSWQEYVGMFPECRRTIQQIKIINE